MGSAAAHGLPAVEASSGGVTFILIYHDIVSGAEREQVGFSGPLAARYKLEPDDFEAHLAAITATGVDVGVVAPCGH